MMSKKMGFNKIYWMIKQKKIKKAKQRKKKLI